MNARRTKMLWAAVLSAWTLGCGGFSNDPFRSGTIVGRISSADASAVVFIDGQPEFRMHPGADGAFEFQDVPIGAASVVVIAPAQQQVARTEAQVRPAQVTDLGEIALGGGGWFVVEVKDSGDPLPGSKVTIVGTPYTGIEVDAWGHATIGPLPEGCYTGHAQIPDGRVGHGTGCVVVGAHVELELEVED